MQEIIKFANDEFGEIRIAQDESGEPWFVAKDVCNALGLTNTTEALRGLDDDEVSNITNSEVAQNGGRSPRIVSEPGFYKLVMRSRKPEAKAFQRWVTHEVLPSIRKRGGYMASVKDETPEETMARAFILAKETIERKNREIAEMKPKALFPTRYPRATSACSWASLPRCCARTASRWARSACSHGCATTVT